MIGENIWNKINVFLRKKVDIFGRDIPRFWIGISILVFIVSISVDETRRLIFWCISILYKLALFIWNITTPDFWLLLISIALFILILNTRKNINKIQTQNQPIPLEQKAEEKPITLDDKDVFILEKLLGQDNGMLLRSELFDGFKFNFEKIFPNLRYWPPFPSNYHKIEIRLKKQGYIKVVPGAHGPFIKITDKGVEAMARRDEELDGPIPPEV